MFPVRMISPFPLALLLALPASSQGLDRLFQGAINAEGRTCPQVTNFRPLGRSTKGSAIVAVACADGSRHVVEIKPDSSLNYVSSCGTFEAVSTKRCF